jgi:hypothetical protein
MGISRSGRSAEEFNITIWAKFWPEVIKQLHGTPEVLPEPLNYDASQSSGRKYLQETYPRFIPRKMKDDTVAYPRRATGHGLVADDVFALIARG